MLTASLIYFEQPKKDKQHTAESLTYHQSKMISHFSNSNVVCLIPPKM